MGTDRAGQIYFYAPNFSDAQFYLLSRSGAQNQTHYAHLIEKQLEKIIFVLCYCNFHFYCSFIKSFCNEAFTV